MADILVDCKNEICPVPLIETRKVINSVKEGQVIEIVGTYLKEASESDITLFI